jgi:hypothetical protein
LLFDDEFERGMGWIRGRIDDNVGFVNDYADNDLRWFVQINRLDHKDDDDFGLPLYCLFPQPLPEL